MKDRLTNGQIFFLLWAACSNPLQLMIPKEFVGVMGISGIFIILAGSMIGAGMICISIRAIQDLAYVAEKNNVAKGLLAIVGIFLFAAVIIGFKGFLEMTKGEIFPDVPYWALAGLLLLPIVMLMRQGISSVAKTAQILLPIGIIFAVVLVFGSIKNIAWIQVLPFQQPEGNITNDVFSVIGIFAPGVVLAQVCNSKEHSKKIYMLVIAAVGVVCGKMLLQYMLSLAVFGAAEGSRILWTEIQLARIIRFGPFLERVEAFYFVEWMVKTVLYIGILLIAIENIVRYISPRLVGKHFEIILGAVVFFAGIWKEDVVMFQLLTQIFLSLTKVFVGGLLVAALWIMIAFKKKGVRSRG